MKTLLMLFLVALLTPTSAADVSGVWDLTMVWSADSKSTGICTFSQAGEKLSGTCGDPDKFPLTGELKDRQVTWQFDVAQNGNNARMIFTGELDEAGTTIKGTCQIVGARDGTFTLVKKP
jgi:hypothetical protein